MNTTTEQFDLARLLSESQLVCIEIGLAEIEGSAGSEASQYTQVRSRRSL